MAQQGGGIGFGPLWVPEKKPPTQPPARAAPSESDDEDKGTRVELVRLGDADTMEAERLVRDQTLIVDQATTSLDLTTTIPYYASLMMASALTTGFLLPLTDQTPLLILGAIEVALGFYMLHHVIGHFARPSMDEDTLAPEALRQQYIALGRWLQMLLYTVNFMFSVSCVVVASLFLFMFTSLFHVQPELQVAAAFVVIFIFVLALLSASHPSVTIVLRSDVILRAKPEETRPPRRSTPK